MLTLLARLFIPNREQTESPAVRQAYGTLCGIVGICLNLLLFAGKFAAGLLTGSVAVTADAFNNLSDAGSSVITLIGFALAGQKPDPDHPFGHGRLEYITGFIVSVIIMLMGFELGKSSVSKLLRPEDPVFLPVTVVILIASIAVKCYMFLYNRRIGEKIDSAAMKAVASDSLSDCIATAVVLISTLLFRFFGFNIDGWCGIAVAIFILRAGISAARETLDPLLGQMPDPALVKRISDIVLSHPEVLSLHDLVVHNYGPGRLMITLHAEVPETGDFRHLHDTIDNIEHELRTALCCEAVIHMDPVACEDEETERLRHQMAALIRERMDGSVTIHDFRLVKGPTHTNLIFDIVVPFALKLPDDTVRKEVAALAASLDPAYRTVIEIDRSYVR